MKIEGYWYSSQTPNFPKPIPFEGEWPEKEKFLSKLVIIENLTELRHFKGISTCRICKCRNGSKEHILANWSWPSGFFHYVKDHNVKPSQEFIDFVLNYPTE